MTMTAVYARSEKQLFASFTVLSAKFSKLPWAHGFKELSGAFQTNKHKENNFSTQTQDKPGRGSVIIARQCVWHHNSAMDARQS